MKYIKKITHISMLMIIGCLFLGMREQQVYTIKLKITNIRNSNGQIQLQFYKDETTFKAEKPYKEIYLPKDAVKNHYMEYTIEVPAGVCGFAMLDDENSNKKMDYGILPKEGFAFSNFYLSGWSRPKFDDFKMNITKDTYVVMKFRYV